MSMKSLLLLMGLCLACANPARAASRITTLAGTGQPGYSGDGGPATLARMNNPYGLTRGPDHCLYVCDMENHVIRRIATNGIISTVAGTGRRGYSGDGGPALKAELNEPYEVRFDAQGNLYFVEMRNHLVRRVDAATRIISTVAGTGKPGFSGDGGDALKAQFNQPHSIQFSPAGALLVCDIGNNRIRGIDLATGRIATFGGTGQRAPTPEGRLPAVPLNGPRAIDFDADGNLWLALREGNAIYRIDKKGTLQRAAGTGAKGFGGNGAAAREATLSGPKGISVSSRGNVYFADTESHSIRMIDAVKGTVELVAGTGQRGEGPDGDPLRCRLSRPHGIFVDRDGAVFVGDSENHRVRVIAAVR